jgi:FkbM family methyltransferase
VAAVEEIDLLAEHLKTFTLALSRRHSLLKCFSLSELCRIKWLWSAISVRETVVLQTRDGVDLIVRREDLFTFNEIFVAEEYAEIHTLGIKPELIVDVGGNVGYSTRYFLTKWPKARIIAFEPVQSNYMQFLCNTTGYSNVKCHNYGLATLPRTTRFVSNGGGSCEDTANGSEYVELYDFFEILENLRIDVLKVDIEGEESNIIADERFSELMSRVITMVVELHGSCEVRDSLIEKLEIISSKLGRRVVRNRVIYDIAEIVWVY